MWWAAPGVGLDNVDLAAATSLGVTVVNAPLSNVLSAAEHTVALILAQARNIPQAHAALVAGRWERAKWEGIELSGKTLGIVGLGRVGRLVAERVASFAMLTLAHDPYISAEQAGELRIELVSLPELMARSDFVSLHVARTPETVGLISAELLASAKPGIRIVKRGTRRACRRGKRWWRPCAPAGWGVPRWTSSTANPSSPPPCSAFRGWWSRRISVRVLQRRSTAPA